MRRWQSAILAVAMALLLFCLPARAETAPADKGRAFTILFENDLFYKADHDYTNGTELSYTTAPDETPDWASNAARLLPFFTDSGDVRTRYAVG